MSIGVSGIFYMKNGSVESKKNFSYTVIQVAYKSKLGCKLGGNVSCEVADNYKKELDKYSIPFELMDTPLDTMSDDMFYYELYDEQSPCLNERMNTIEAFLREIYASDEVEQIILDINYLDGFKEKTIKIGIEGFAKKMVELYITESVYIPVVRFVLSR